MMRDCTLFLAALVLLQSCHVGFSFHISSSSPSFFSSRSDFLRTGTTSIIATLISAPKISNAQENIAVSPVLAQLTGDAKKLFGEARVLEQQGNIQAAQRIYNKITKIEPKYIYGWASLGNTQVALGILQPADESYTRAIDLCLESQKEEEKFGVPRCNDAYLLYLNRGALRLNNGMKEVALKDLETADNLRGRPDAIILQNRARAREVNGFYAQADRDYDVAISMQSNEVAPFWLRAAMVKFQLGDTLGAFDLVRRVENRFPEAPEVRAALATLLTFKGDQITANRKFLEIPDRARLKYVDEKYLNETIAWPPKMQEYLKVLTKAVGDDKRKIES
jgi:tetratricopeptide (TPR) repeat protein